MTDFEAKRRRAKLALVEAELLPRGPAREHRERAAKLDLLEAECGADRAHSKREARAHFENLFGRDFERAPEAQRRNLLGAFNDTVERPVERR
jgi:hypothetical protein